MDDWFNEVWGTVKDHVTSGLGTIIDYFVADTVGQVPSYDSNYIAPTSNPKPQPVYVTTASTDLLKSPYLWVAAAAVGVGLIVALKR